MWNICLLNDPRGLSGALHFGGGASAPPTVAQPSAPAADTEAAKQKVGDANRRRVGGMDALQGNVLGSLRDQSKARTLGASATSQTPYTGEQ